MQWNLQDISLNTGIIQEDIFIKMKMCGCISVQRPDKSCEDIPCKKSRGVRNPLMSKNGHDEWDSQRDRKGDGQYRGCGSALSAGDSQRDRKGDGKYSIGGVALSFCPLSWRVHHNFDGDGHRVGRVLSFFSTRRNWDSPTPKSAEECAPPPFGPGGGAHSFAGEGLGESQFRRGDIHCGALYI
jgi:hypothetical protein